MQERRPSPLAFNFGPIRMDDGPLLSDDAPLPRGALRRPSRQAATESGVHPDLIGRSKPCELPGCHKRCLPRPGETVDEWGKRSACCPSHSRAISKRRLPTAY